jgi:hypothetical protein
VGDHGGAELPYDRKGRLPPVRGEEAPHASTTEMAAGGVQALRHAVGEQEQPVAGAHRH